MPLATEHPVFKIEHITPIEINQARQRFQIDQIKDLDKDPVALHRHQHRRVPEIAVSDLLIGQQHRTRLHIRQKAQYY